MKNRVIIPALFFLLILASCEKESPQPNNGSNTTTPPPPPPTTGTIYFKNNQVDPYTIFLDGTNMGILASGSTSNGYTITSGINHSLKAEQYSGYVFFPTIYTSTGSVNPGLSIIWAF